MRHVAKSAGNSRIHLVSPKTLSLGSLETKLGREILLEPRQLAAPMPRTTR